ncbi:MAG: TonB-dependent receptor [Dysgonamonadaceae bacterium]|jgi:TonB-linked SusC/RagA family outer membrane protein|nr:TonB-dependent receptor [Dysgonamonadaceae bacterium]
MIKTVFCGLLILLVCGSLSAQIRGVVKDNVTKEILAGVSVHIKSSASGTITDGNGYFKLEASPEDILVFSFIGYQTLEVISGVNLELDVFMIEDSRLMDEVVVVGYGTQSRKELTGSIVKLSQHVIDHPDVSFDRMLGGAVAGVNVTQGSGQPGESVDVRIRGGNSIDASNEPLYVIDGFIFFSGGSSTKAGMVYLEGNLNPLSSINPSDIESIEVLKDVSATAIYGSRGANGVIIVTTGKGKHGKNNINYQYSIGWDTPAKRLKLLNAGQWARIQKDYFLNKGRYTDEEIDLLGEGYDWQNAVLQTGIRQSHNISIGGSGTGLRYLVSGNYLDQEGIVINTGFRRYNARINFEHNITDKFTVGVTATAGKNIQNSLTAFQEVDWSSSPFSSGITSSLTYALFIPPVVPVYDLNGDYNYRNPFEYGYLVSNGKAVNPVSDLNNSIGEAINSSFIGNFNSEYKIINGLTAKVNAGLYSSHVTQNFFAPSYTALGMNVNAMGGIGKKDTEIVQSEFTLSYSRQINENNYTNILAGYTYQHTGVNYTINRVSDFTEDTYGIKILEIARKSETPISLSPESSLYSMLARINYTFAKRYNMTVTIRGDRSSRFAKDNKWGYFPSAGISWNAMSNLKLRLTCGNAGNQEIGNYEYGELFNAYTYNGQTVYTKTNNGNNNLKWETTTMYNAGIDAELYNRRISLAADVYYKKTSDLLLAVPLDPTQGGGTQLRNVGNVSNKGIELSFNYNVIDNKILRWNTSFNFSRNINNILSLGGSTKINRDKRGEEQLRVGEPLGAFYGLIFDGIVQQEDDVSQLPTTVYGAPRAGDVKFRDISGPDGIPDNVIDYNDITYIGDIQPSFIYGFQTNVKFRSLDLFVSFQGTHGNKIYNSLGFYLERPDDSYNKSSELLNSWTTDNPSKTLPTLSNYRYYSYLDSRYVQDASYLRLKDITLGYTFNQHGKYTIRLFISALNLLTVTKYKGYDPEISRGIDRGAYPASRTIQAGIRIGI